jgi:hypothetical protein
MPAPGSYPDTLQRLLFVAYKATGLGDASLGAALAASDRSGRSVGSEKVVEAWRSGRSSAPIGALEVVLDHCGYDHVRRILSPLCRKYGGEYVEIPDTTEDGPATGAWSSRSAPSPASSRAPTPTPPTPLAPAERRSPAPRRTVWSGSSTGSSPS